VQTPDNGPDEVCGAGFGHNARIKPESNAAQTNFRAFAVGTQTLKLSELRYGGNGAFQRSAVVFDDTGSALELVNGQSRE
jgi:hypothetical protein